MINNLITKISEYVSLHPSLAPFPPVPNEVIEDAESKLGFPLPDLLKLFYLQIGNGYAGSSCDIMGLPEGCCSDLGNLLEVYPILKEGQESEGREWKVGLLPFCAWGCNIFSCADCSNSRHLLSTFEDFRLRPQGYNLERFFEWWAGGVDILSQEEVETEATEILNPFTKQKSNVYRRRRSQDSP